MRASSLFICTVLLGACASDRQLPAAERVRLNVASVQWPTQGAQIAIDGRTVTEGGTSGALKGLGEGLVLGLNPYSWILGGPLFLGPLGAYLGAKCGKARSQDQHQIPRLRHAVEQVGLSSMKPSLEATLSRTVAGAVSEEPAASHVLVIDEVSVELGSTYDSEVRDCTPALFFAAAWHLTQGSEGRSSATQVTGCVRPTRQASFVELFADETRLAALVAESLSRLGREVAIALRAPEPRKCEL